MEHNHDTGSGILGWVIFAGSFIASFMEPLTAGLKFIAALTAAVIGVIKLWEWWRDKNYKKRKRGGI